LEELCRAMWQENKRDFLRHARGASVGYLIAQFEREDAERTTLRVAGGPPRVASILASIRSRTIRVLTGQDVITGGR